MGFRVSGSQSRFAFFDVRFVGLFLESKFEDSGFRVAGVHPGLGVNFRNLALILGFKGSGRSVVRVGG